MFCIACGAPLAAGLSYCNRCGTSLKERSESRSGSTYGFLTAITLIAITGLGIMLGGALSLKREANLDQELVGFFMFFTFLIVLITEVLLVRQLSKLTSVQKPNIVEIPQPFPQQLVGPGQFHPPQLRTLVEPVPSVTENTTRTLEYSRSEPGR